jgi:hypothetical protein
MADRHEPTPEQKRRALVSAIVLAVTVVAIYVAYMLKFAR